MKVCLLCTTLVGGVLCLFELVMAPLLVGLYNTDPKVITAAVGRMYIIVIPYLIFGYADVLVGVIRGHGISLPPVIINLVATCIFRIIYITVLDVPKVNVSYVFLSYPISWTLLLVILIAYWLHLRKKKSYGAVPR